MVSPPTQIQEIVLKKIPDVAKNEPIVASETTTTADLSKVAEGDSPHLAVMHMQFPPEIDSVGGLIKISSNVFIGRVIRKVGDDFTYSSSIPSTRFEVEVVGNITGDVSGKVSLIQNGVGYSSKNEKFYLREGDMSSIASGKFNPNDVYLKTDATYLFAAGYDAKKDLYGIGAPPYDRTLITTNPGLSKAQIMTEAHANPRVQQFFDLAPK